jgi:prephenate dehydratase
MNTQRLATLRISPLHVQQGLFASLALMITLIVVQQFAHWTQKQEVVQIQHVYSHTAPFAKASALKATDVGMSLQPVDDAAAAVEPAPRQQSWVF